MEKQIFKVDNTGQLIRIVVIGAVGIIGLALAIKMVRNRIKNNSGGRLVNDENVRLATELNTAIHPGRNFFTNMFMGADKDALFRLAPDLKKFDDISKEYQNLYQESLTLELQDALGEEYPAFIEKLQNVKAGSDAMSGSDIAQLTEAVYNEINGLNWTVRDLAPFNSLLRLSDADFKRFVSTYNSSHGNFFEDLEGESGVSALFAGIQKDAFDSVKKKILTRYELLY